MTVPRVSVVMAAYNGERFLAEAMSSILEQTFSDLEFIIVSEFGTSEASLRIIDSFNDERIVHVRNTTKLGLVPSLNVGMSLAKGEYIARMDGDDVSEKERLSMQVAFLDAHPDIGVIGTDLICIDAEGHPLVHCHYSETPGAVRWEMFLRTAIANSTTMIRRGVLEKVGLYDPKIRLAEDYDLWLRILRISDIVNLPVALLRYRIHGSNVSLVNEGISSTLADGLAISAASVVLGEEVDPYTMGMIRDRSKIRNGNDSISASELLLNLYRSYLDQMDLSYEERREVHILALRIELAILMRTMQVDPWASAKILSEIVSNSPGHFFLDLLPALGQLMTLSNKLRMLSINNE